MPITPNLVVPKIAPSPPPSPPMGARGLLVPPSPPPQGLLVPALSHSELEGIAVLARTLHWRCSALGSGERRGLRRDGGRDIVAPPRPDGQHASTINETGGLQSDPHRLQTEGW